MEEKMKFKKDDIGKRFIIKIDDYSTWREVSVLEFTADMEQVKIKIGGIDYSEWYDNSFYIIKNI